MIQRCEGHGWPGVPATVYKDEPGTWMSVTRRVLASDSGTGFETRYFEVAPGGYTSYEKHAHEHVVVVLRGRGRVRLGEDWFDLALHDTVHVPSMQPHQFASVGEEPFGMLCIVDRDRDRPILIDTEGGAQASE